jgi:hypothetical protein
LRRELRELPMIIGGLGTAILQQRGVQR